MNITNKSMGDTHQPHEKSMETFEWIAVLVAVILLVQNLGVLITGLNLLFQRLRASSTHIIDRNSLTEEEWAFYQPTIDTLEAMGFEYKGCLASTSMLSGALEPTHEIVFVHPAHNCLASVYGHFYPGAAVPVSVGFISGLGGHAPLHTVDCLKHTLLPYPKTIQLQDGYLGTLEQQWDLHRNTQAEQNTRTTEPNALNLQNTSLEDIAAQSSQFYQHLFQGLVESKRVIKLFGNATIFNPLFAFKYANTLIKGQQKLYKSAIKVPELSEQNSTFLLRRQLDHTNPSSPFSKIALFLLTGVLFYVSFGVVFSWAIVPAVLAVLILHELGHYLAMRIFKYKNTSIFFVPLLGAATVGKKANAPLWQEVTLYLAGPVPGILLGLAIIKIPIAYQHPWLMTFAIVSLVINFLNLLPIFPLDGGRVIERLYFSRFPIAKCAFTLLSAIGFFILGYAFDNHIIAFFGLLPLFALPNQWQHYQLLKQFSRVKSHTPDTELFNWLNQVEANPNKRFHAAKQLLEFFEHTPAKWQSILLGTLVYFSLLAGGLAVTAHHFMVWQFDDYYDESHWIDRVAQTQNPEEKLTLLLEAINAFKYEDDPHQAIEFYTQAKTISVEVAEPNVNLANLRLLKVEIDEIPLTQSDIAYIEFNTLNDPNATRYHVIQVLLEVTNTQALMDTQDKIALLQNAEAKASSEDVDDYLDSSLNHRLGELYLDLNNQAQAESYFLAGFEQERNPQLGVYSLSNFRALRDLYFEDKRYIEGIDIADKRLQFLDDYLKTDQQETDASFYSRHIQNEKVSPLQTRAWFNHLNGWHQDALADATQALALLRDVRQEDNGYDQSIMTLLFDAIVFARGHRGEAQAEIARVLDQPKAHLQKFAKQCDCKVREGLTGYLFEQYVMLLNELGIHGPQ